jgi:type IV pilus assembly protein PilO
VSAVANLSRIVTLHDFTIAPQQRAEGLKMTIQAKTYRYLEEER